ncbi:MAG: BamA/TamA family outer membrane protein [Ignavibacteriales bacterium]|nr:BamA/TamA family outer membrane protein [Ignavibacteriales bacterium]
MTRLFCFLALLAVTFSSSLAQLALSEYEVRKIVFGGNSEISEDVLRSLIETKETPGWFWKTLGKISTKIGEAPRYYDPVAFEGDLGRLRRFYADQGFFHASVDTSLEFHPDDQVVDLAFRIHEGARSIIDTLELRGISGLPSILREDIEKKQTLRRGDPYIVQDVDRELRRIVGTFANHGYVRVGVDTVIARQYASTNNVTLIFSFSANERYSFGRITVEHDTTATERVEEDVVHRHLDFQEGDFYSEEKKVDSERNLNRLGVFEASRIEPVVSREALNSLQIPIRVFVRPRPFHELTPEIGAYDENSAFNLVAGVGYNNRNFFGDARNFLTRLRVSLQSIQDIEFSRVFSETGFRDSSLVSRIEVSSQVIQPYVFSNKVSMSVTLAALLEKQKSYFAPIYQARVGLNAQLGRYTRGTIEFNLERVDPTLVGSDTTNAKRELDKREDLKRQFNSILTMTIQRDKRDDLFTPSEGFFHLLSIEEAGFLPKIFGGLLGSELPFANYYKISGVAQWYWDAGTDRRFIWAGRVRGGFARLYDNFTVPVPITRRFFSGGSESIRGWKSRELGAVPFPNQGGNTLFEATLEGRWHLFRHAGSLWFISLPNISLVGFFDVGNIWTDLKFIRASEFAMAAGLGFRWDTIAGPIRIDLGLRVYDPFETTGRKWVTERRFFHDTYSLVHFGIGHSF